MKPFDYSKIPHYKFYGFVKHVLGPFAKLLYKVKYKGIENIPEKGGYILAINHTSFIDPILVAIPKQAQTLHFMSKAELFNNPVMAWVVTHVYGFPVRRGKGDTTAIDYGVKILEEGHVMAICPEGKRMKDKDGVPQKAKAGVAVIAKATGADILPVAIHSNGSISPFKGVTVSYGKLIKNSELGIEQGTPSEIKHAAGMVMNHITALWEAENCK